MYSALKQTLGHIPNLIMTLNFKTSQMIGLDIHLKLQNWPKFEQY